MAKESISTDAPAQPIHTRTTGDAAESQVLVLGIDGSDAVVPADSTGLTVTAAKPATAAVSAVPASVTSVTLLAAKPARLSGGVHNASSTFLYVKLGSGASAISFTVKLAAGAYWELPHPCYTGLVTGVWVNAAAGDTVLCETAA